MTVITSSLLPEPRARKHEEDDLQKAVIDFLDLALPADAIPFHIPNGGKRSKREGGRLKRLGVRAGLPDLCVLYRGKVVFIELKAARGVVGGYQKVMHHRLLYAGFPVLVCRSVDEVEYALHNANIPLKARIAA